MGASLTPADWLEERFRCQLQSYWDGSWAPGTYVRPLLEFHGPPCYDDPSWDRYADDIDEYYARRSLPGDCQSEVYLWRAGDPVYTGQSCVDSAAVAVA